MIRAFDRIKEELAKDVSLAFPLTGPGAPILQLFVDASNISIGSALFQEQNGELKPISYVSKLLSKTELNYSSYDKEILGLVRGITAHNQYLAGREFKVFTDCKNILYLYKMKHCCPRLVRLLESISNYNFTIEHVAETANVVSDMLSRLTQYTSSEYHQKLIEGLPYYYVPPDLEEHAIFGEETLYSSQYVMY